MVEKQNGKGSSLPIVICCALGEPVLNEAGSKPMPPLTV